jgi:hypothetical protein
MSEDSPKPTKITTTRDSKAGRVETDARGRNVWRWKKTGADDSTSVLLKRLDNEALQLEPTARVPRPGTAESKKAGTALPAGTRDVESKSRERATGRGQAGTRASTKRGNKGGGGFDPYNSSR